MGVEEKERGWIKRQLYPIVENECDTGIIAKWEQNASCNQTTEESQRIICEWGCCSTTSVRNFLTQMLSLAWDLASSPSDPPPVAAHISQAPPTAFSLLDLNKLHFY